MADETWVDRKRSRSSLYSDSGLIICPGMSDTVYFGDLSTCESDELPIPPIISLKPLNSTSLNATPGERNGHFDPASPIFKDAEKLHFEDSVEAIVSKVLNLLGFDWHYFGPDDGHMEV